MCTLKGEQPDTSEYSQADIQKANNCRAKFRNWLKEHPISPIMIETPLVSEEYKYGGTLDLFAEFNSEFILVDFKTRKALYDEYFYQLAAYRQLLHEQGWPVANARILRIGRDEDEGFEEVIRTNLETEYQIFLKCLEIYQLSIQRW
jgi:predicted RecB family nuclease